MPESWNFCMTDIVIKDRQTRVDGERFRVIFTVVTEEEEMELWFEIPIEFEHWVTDSYDAPVVGLLLPAMSAGSDLQIEGPLSTNLAWFLPRTVMPILAQVHKKTSPIKLKGYESIHSVERVSNAVALGLSNGVDSLTAIHDYGPDGDAPEELRITHLIFNDVGSAGRYGNDHSTDLSQKRYKNVASSAFDSNLPLIKVSSNVDEFQGRLTHVDTHIMKNATTPLLLQKGIKHFLYAADGTWPDMRVLADNISFTDPMLIPGFSTERVTFKSVGSEYDRIEKVSLLSNYELATKYLDPCTRSFPNCSSCNKCMQVLITLDANGYLDRFSRVFDLDIYRRFKIRYAVWARFFKGRQTRAASKLYRPTRISEYAAYYSLIVLNRLDYVFERVIPRYRSFSRTGFMAILRRKYLYRN